MTVQTFNISLPKDLVTAIDEVAAEEYRNRSELIREAVRLYLADVANWKSVFSYAKTRAKAKHITSEQDVSQIVTAYRKGK